jgi:CubicO group peptidase (beta-lactamase class C family)
MSMDIEGYIVEKLSGQPLPDFIKEHIYKPLGMTDADFYVPKDKRDRFATLYTTGKNGELVLSAADPAGKSADYLAEPGMPSGGGGMVSTGADYYRFADMLRRKGELDGKRILSPASVQLMTSNHLSKELLNGHFGIGNLVMREGMGYGYNGGVEFDPLIADLPTGKGTYFWSGAAGTWFWVDPTNDVVFVGMIQRMLGPQSPPLEQDSRAIVYGALVDPGK